MTQRKYIKINFFHVLDINLKQYSSKLLLGQMSK